MIKTKRYVDSSPDGSNQLFQVPEEFISGSLWVTQSSGGVIEPNEMGGGFYQLVPAPTAGSKLYLTYDVEDSSVAEETGLTPWEHDQMNKLLLAIQEQQKAINNIDEAMSLRVTNKDWNTWASVIGRQLADVKAAIKE
jgi:hypothetical protein